MAGLWIPDHRLLKPGANIQQNPPAGPLRIDLTSPLARGIANCWVPSSGERDLVTGDRLTYSQKHTSGHRGFVGEGAYLYADNGGSVDDRLASETSYQTLVDANAGARTRVYVFRPTYAGDSTQYICHYLGGDSITTKFVTSTGEVTLGYDGGNGYKHLANMPGGTLTVDEINVIGISINRDTELTSVYVNGLRWDDAVSYDGSAGLIGGGLNPQSAPIPFGRSNYTTHYHVKGFLYYMANWVEWMDEDRLAAVCENPYQFLVPA